MLEGIAQQDLDDASTAAAASATAAAAAASSGGHDSWSKVMEAAAAAAATTTSAASPSAAAVNTTAPQSITPPHEVQHRYAPLSVSCSILSLLTQRTPSGWLLKQRRHWGLGPDTHVRWFVLDNRRLMWFPGDGTAAAACFCLVSLALQTRSTACSPPHSKAPRLPAAAST